MVRPRKEISVALAYAGIIFGILGPFLYPLVFGFLALTLGLISFVLSPKTLRGLSVGAMLLGIISVVIWIFYLIV